MTNLEFYRNKMRNNGLRAFAVNKETGEPCSCYDILCEKCLLSQHALNNTCFDAFFNWLLEEHEEPKVDWSKVAVNTPIYVSDNRDHWFPRYFAKYEDGKVYAFSDGANSWSSGPTPGFLDWGYARLATKEEMGNV